MTYSPLDLVESYLRRFVAYPSEQAVVAHTLWIAHAHLIDCFETSPRLAFMSAEKESGKTRALELTALFVPGAIMAVSASPAYVVRRIEQGQCTLLYDEIDAVFGSAKREELNVDLKSILNEGYRRGAIYGRCVMNGKKVETEDLPVFAPVAVAGLRELPDTLASRAIIVRMKRRAPEEKVEPFRYRYHEGEAKRIREELAEWCAGHDVTGAEPELPAGITDRVADCWEPLIAIADAAGDDWPVRARAAATYLSKRTADESMTRGVELLEHIREAFGAEQKIWTETLRERLAARDESPWKDPRGNAIGDRYLARLLKAYGIKSKSVRIGEAHKRGFAADDFADAWRRYCPSASPMRDKRDMRDIFDNKNNFVPDVPDVPDRGPNGGPKANGHAKPCPRCSGEGCDWCEPEPGSEPGEDLGDIPYPFNRRGAQ
jgi:hypothetical protein